MITYELLRPESILIVRPEAPLEASDFQRLARVVDPYIEAHGKLHGVMIDAESFPGWRNLAGLMAHMRFVKNHHRRVQKVAVVSDQGFLAIAPAIVGHLVSADIRHFSRSQKEKALRWLQRENRLPTSMTHAGSDSPPNGEPARPESPAQLGKNGIAPARESPFSLTARDIMSRDLVLVPQEMALPEAAHLLSQE